MTSRVRCSCGRVYDPVKHTTCPECGAESAVESVVVAEKVKPPVPPDLNRDSAGNGIAGAERTKTRTEARDQLTGLAKKFPWKVYAGIAVVFLLGILWLIAGPKQVDRSQMKPDVSKISPEPAPAGTPRVAGGDDSDLSLKLSPTPDSQASQTPTPASSGTPSFAQDGFQLDPRLIGAWETRGPWPPNSGHVQTVHWTIETDGHFTFAGPWSDAGAITASNGKMKWFSNNNSQPADLTYEFNGDALLTHGPLGDALWWRAKHSSQQPRRSTGRDRPKTYSTPDDAVKREILKKVFRHFP